MGRRPDNPRISLNKLSEFMTASIPRQRRIIRDQKFPPDYLRTYYREAQEAVAACLASDLEDLAVVERQIDILNQQEPGTVGAQRRIASNVDALETFLDMLDDINLMGATPQLAANDAPKLRVQNVDISVRPEVILRAEGRSGMLVGALGSLLGREGIAFVTGSTVAGVTGPLEGLLLGTAAGFAGWKASRSHRPAIAVILAASAGAVAGGLIHLAGGTLLGGSLHAVAEALPGMRLSLEQLSPTSGGALRLFTATAEAALFAVSLAVGLHLPRRWT